MKGTFRGAAPGGAWTRWGDLKKRIFYVLDEHSQRQATPKGLRHGFGVAAIQAGIPLNVLQRWLGPAQLSTTAMYANAVGPEERNIAARIWT